MRIIGTDHHELQCLVDFFPQAPVAREDAAKVMARLNALFPAAIFLPPTEVQYHSLSPCSPALSESLRLYVYQYLTNTHPTSEGCEPSFADKFIARCGSPTYEKMRNMLIRYAEETKKIEETYFLLPDRGAPSSHTPIIKQQSPRMPSYPASLLENAEQSPITHLESNTDISETSIVVDASDTSVFSSCEVSVVSDLPDDSRASGLLCGVPGREITPAKTDGAAFAFDFGAPDLLTYPNDLNAYEFHVHPLAHSLKMDSQQMARLGLTFPKEHSSRDFWYAIDSADELDLEDHGKMFTPVARTVTKKMAQGPKRQRARSGDLAQHPSSLDPIPESSKPAASSVIERIIGRVKYDFASRVSSKEKSPKLDVADNSENPLCVSSAVWGKKKAQIKSRISTPRVAHGPAVNWHSDRSNEMVGDKHALSEEPWTETDPRDDQEEPIPLIEAVPSYHIATPRISPMEYARAYLVDKARDPQTHLPEPEFLWFWTPGHEKFLIIPRLPPCLRRQEFKTWPRVNSHLSCPSSIKYAPSLRAEHECPRLSLNLGRMKPFMPSVINLTSLQGTDWSEMPLHHGIASDSIIADERRMSFSSSVEDEPPAAVVTGQSIISAKSPKKSQLCSGDTPEKRSLRPPDLALVGQDQSQSMFVSATATSTFRGRGHTRTDGRCFPKRTSSMSTCPSTTKPMPTDQDVGHVRFADPSADCFADSFFNLQQQQQKEICDDIRCLLNQKIRERSLCLGHRKVSTPSTAHRHRVLPFLRVTQCCLRPQFPAIQCRTCS